jgi:acyl-CoA thioesterase-1
MRVLIFGDSITQGFWAVESGWVDRVRKYYDALQVENLEDGDEPTIFNLGISADNSENILNRIEAETVARTRVHHASKPVVVVQTGVNDCSQLQGRREVSLEQYKANLSEIIKKTRPLSSKIVFVGFAACDEARTTPVFWDDHHYTNKNIKQYEDAMKAVAKEDNVNFISVFDQFISKLDDKEGLLPDGLHPSDAGHELIYKIVMPKLRELLT